MEFLPFLLVLLLGRTIGPMSRVTLPSTAITITATSSAIIVPCCGQHCSNHLIIYRMLEINAPRLYGCLNALVIQWTISKIRSSSAMTCLHSISLDTEIEPIQYSLESMLFYPIDARIRYIMSTSNPALNYQHSQCSQPPLSSAPYIIVKIVPLLNISIECWFVFFILGKAMILPNVASCYTMNIEQIHGFTNLPLIQYMNLSYRIPRVTSTIVT